MARASQSSLSSIIRLSVSVATRQHLAVGCHNGAIFVGQNELLGLHTREPDCTIETPSIAHQRQKKVQQIQEELTSSHNREQVMTYLRNSTRRIASSHFLPSPFR